MEDDSLTAHHIALYYAIFYMWNRSSFATQLSVSRSELMLLSKIGSANTYIKSMKSLHLSGLIKYFPSNNPLKGSIVTCITFDTSSGVSTDTTIGVTSDSSSGITTDTTTDTTIATLYKPIKPNKGINVETRKGKNVPPARDTFISFCKNLDIDYTKMGKTIEAKYDTWVKAGWKDGYGNDIIDWEQKIINTIPNLKNWPSKEITNQPSKAKGNWGGGKNAK